MSYKQIRGKYTQGDKSETVCHVKAGQSIVVTAKAFGIPKGSLCKWVRFSAKSIPPCILALT